MKRTALESESLFVCTQTFEIVGSFRNDIGTQHHNNTTDLSVTNFNVEVDLR